jgi:hypothetical protein
MNLHHGISYRTGLSTGALVSGLFFQAVALVTWSWISGFALGMLSPRTTWASGALFFGFFIGPASHRWLFSTGFSWSTGWAWLPLLLILLNFLFVLLPCYRGICRSSDCEKSPRMIPLALWTIVVGGLALWTRGWDHASVENWSRGGAALTLLQLARHREAWNPGINQVLATAVLTSPIFYVLVRNSLSIRQGTTD